MGWSSNTDEDVLKTVLVEVFDCGLESVVFVVVVLVWILETTTTIVVSEVVSDGCWCWGISETIESAIVSDAVSVVWISYCLGSTPRRCCERATIADEKLGLGLFWTQMVEYLYRI